MREWIKRLTPLWHKLIGDTKWHEDTSKGYRWRRWTPDGWEYRPMTEREAEDMVFWQAP